MATGNIIFSTSSTTITTGGIIDASDFERSTNLQVDNVSGNINISGGINTGSVSNLGSNANVKISGGTSGQTIITDGSGNLSWGSSYAGPNIRVFTSSETFTVPTGVSRLKITAVGGGGGGAGWSGSTGGRSMGGMGACAIALVTVTGGTLYTVTIGAGGAGANPNYGTGTGEDGAPGNETWFGINSGSKLISCTGGTGGTATWAGGCCGFYIASSAAGVDGTSSTTGTLIRSGDGISAGGTTNGTISGAWIAWGLSYQLFGGRPVWNDTASTLAQTWSPSSKYIPGCGGVYAASPSSGAASGGMSGVMIIEY